MRKIPTVFKRDPGDMKRVLPEVTPGCEWVLAGEGKATRKYDGTCVMLDKDGVWWARREVKPGKPRPMGYRVVEADPITNKAVGWEPIEQSGFAKWWADAVAGNRYPLAGTYELCGPKVQGDSEGFGIHLLVRHEDAEEVEEHLHSRTFDGIRDLVTTLGYEGIVYHHPDGRMAKIKARDFPRERVDA